MIVKCEQCQTRFKIPDEKVTDKGVKVRCTRCGNTFRVTRDQAQAAASFGVDAAPPGATTSVPMPPVAVPPSREADPFAKFGSSAEPGFGDPTRPGVFALGVEATRVPERVPARATPSRASFDFSSLVPPAPAPASPAAAPPAPFDFTALAPPHPAPAAAAFDFNALGATTAPPPAAKPFDFSAMTAPPPPAAVPVSHSPRAPPPPSAATPAFDFSALGPASQPEPGVAAPRFDFGAPASTLPPRAHSSAPFDDGPSVEQASGFAPRADEFFGTPLKIEERKPLLDLPDDVTGDEAKRALFDLPEPPAEVVAAPLAVPAPLAPAPVSRPSAIITRPVAPRRNVLGVIVNVVIALVLVVALVLVGSALLNDGKVTTDSLSPEHLKATFMPQAEFAATDISNGLYETKSGRSVFFVRGEIQNRGRSTTHVVVQADIVEGSRVVRSAHALAGAIPTPEELYTLGVGDELERRLEVRVAPRAVQLEPGGSASFLVVFTEFPPDLKGFRVRVLASADRGPTALRP